MTTALIVGNDGHVRIGGERKVTLVELKVAPDYLDSGRRSPAVALRLRISFGSTSPGCRRASIVSCVGVSCSQPTPRKVGSVRTAPRAPSSFMASTIPGRTGAQGIGKERP